MQTGSSNAFATAEIPRMAGDGDPQALALFHEIGRCLGLGLAGLVNTLNLPLYVIGGGVAKAWPLFSAALMKALTDFSYVYRLTRPSTRGHTQRNTTRDVPATLGADAGLLGAAMLPCAL